MAVPSKVIELVERFGRDLDLYKRAAYKEARVRVEFIDPFFEALGWDVRNVGGKREHTKDVIHEDAISIAGKTSAPDYSFRVGGARKFFLEAKKPSVDLKDNIGPAYQLRRYSWSVKLPLGILTDFEEFAVYDCRQSPKATDSANVGQLLYVTFDQYLDRFDEIRGLFAKESVQGGSLDQFVGTIKGKRGTSEVDKELLKEIEGWRDVLARNIALRNEHLSVHELNFAVQRTIDRVLFLRIAEDRGIEIYGNLRDLVSTPEIYSRLKVLYKQADEKYNAGLFDFKTDTLTPGLSIDDKVLKPILENLYYPKSPYEFSVMPVEILGQVYEQFLGKVIRLTPSHRAKVEEKPEVKKAGGVYYTPSYIVDYIVTQTVGKLIEGKSPKQVSKLRILDPACGSGSFLLGAFQYLLDYHLEWYEDHDPSSLANKRQPAVYQGTSGEWRLTSVEKKRILLNNIYGVDIDRQAVEVTKLSLLLKVLEGETEESLGQQLSLWRERALPNLGENIKCGNSLIGPDFFEGQLLPDEVELRRINPFDWALRFPNVVKEGGFNAVIGNPPYGALIRDKESSYLDDNYGTFRGVKDVYVCFIEKGMKLLQENGRFSYIVPSAWLGGPKYTPLRSFLLNYQLENIIMLPFDVFADAYIDTAIIVACNNPIYDDHVVQTHTFGKREKLNSITITEEQYKIINQNIWLKLDNKKFVIDPQAVQLLGLLNKTCTQTIGDIALMKRGVLFNKNLLSARRKTDKHFMYFEGDIYRYRANLKVERWVEFGPKMKERPKEFSWFEEKRILLRRLVNRRQQLMAMIVNDTFITNKNLYTIKSRESSVKLTILLAILNSKLISYLYLKQVSQATKDDFPQVTIRDVKALPVPSSSRLNACSPNLSILVENMLELQNRLAGANLPGDKKLFLRQIEDTDRKIDYLVYSLYGLTEEEIKIVEEAAE